MRVLVEDKLIVLHGGVQQADADPRAHEVAAKNQSRKGGVGEIR